MRGVICGETTVTSVAERSTASIFCSAIWPPPTIRTLWPSSLRKMGYRDITILPLRAEFCQARNRVIRAAGPVRQESSAAPFLSASQKTAADFLHDGVRQDSYAAIFQWHQALRSLRNDGPRDGQRLRARPLRRPDRSSTRPEYGH